MGRRWWEYRAWRERLTSGYAPTCADLAMACDGVGDAELPPPQFYVVKQ